MPRKTSQPAPKQPQLPLEPAASRFDVAQQLRRWTDNVLGIAGSAGALSLNLAQARAGEPRQQQSLEKAGSMLPQVREGAGMTWKEQSEAVAIADPKMLEQAEVRAFVKTGFEMTVKFRVGAPAERAARRAKKPAP